MSKLYNNFRPYSINFNDFFLSVDNFLTKNQLNFLGNFFTAMLSSSSINFDKIALELFSLYPDIKFDSILTRISRFLNSSNNNFHSLFDNVIKHILSNFKVKHDDNRVFISFDHMFVKDKFTVFMLSIKIGKQGFPIFFNAFEGKGKEGHGDAFKLDNIKNALQYVHDIIKSIDDSIEIVFLADRWFGNFFPLFHFIDKVLEDSFVFRCKDNFKILYYDKKEKHKIWTELPKLPSLKYHSKFYENLEFTKNKFQYNLTVCKSADHQERWYLISNVDPRRAKKFYGYRFGGIETIFKNQKSNGFYLEKTGLKHLHAFDNLYSLLCIAVSYYICLGTDMSKNSSSYKHIGMRTSKKTSTGNLTRIISLFQAGLKLFKLALSSVKYIRIKFNFKLYDV